MKKATRFLMVILVLVYAVTCIGLANAEVLQIKPKGDKKIKIGVMDLISSIEVAALFNQRYQKWSKERGWDCQIFDLNFNFAQAGPVMENVSIRLALRAGRAPTKGSEWRIASLFGVIAFDYDVPSFFCRKRAERDPLTTLELIT